MKYCVQIAALVCSGGWKNGVGWLLRSVWLSSDGEMMWYVFPFCPVVGGVKVRWHGLHWGPVRQVSTICEKIYDNG